MKLFYKIKSGEQRICPSNFILVLISLYSIWQIGIAFFAGQSLSLYGGIPLDVDSTIVSICFISAFALSIPLNIIFPAKSPLLAKICLILGALSSLLMLLPLSVNFIQVCFYVNTFICTFMIGVVYSFEINVLDNRSDLKFAFLGCFITFPIIGLIQSKLFVIPFFVYAIVALVVNICLLAGFFCLPNHVPVNFKRVKQAYQEAKLPKSLLFNCIATIFVATLSLTFSTSVAEEVNHGMLIYYGSSLLFVIASFIVIKCFKVKYQIIVPFLLVFITIGFVLLAVSSFYDVLKIPALILCSASLGIGNLSGYLLNSVFLSSPTRFKSQIPPFLGLLVVIIQIVLLQLFKNDIAVLSIIISVICLSLLLSLTVLTPYLASSKQTTEKKTDEQAVENKYQLTPREYEYALLMLEGYSNTEIAKKMVISSETAKTYRKKIYEKMDAHSINDVFNALK